MVPFPHNTTQTCKTKQRPKEDQEGKLVGGERDTNLHETLRRR